MKTSIKRILLIILTPLIGYYLLYLIISDGRQSIEYTIYKNDTNSCFCSKLFFHVPKSYKDRIAYSVIEENNIFSLVSVSNNNTYSANEYLFLIEKEAIPISNLLIYKNLDQKKYSDYQDKMVNLDAFNRYINYHSEFSFYDIQNKYFFFRWFDEGDYKIIRKKEDMEALLDDFPLDKGREYDKVLKLSSLLDYFDILCWQEHDGLLGFNFTFEERMLLAVEAEFISCIGNEPIPCAVIAEIEY